MAVYWPIFFFINTFTVYHQGEKDKERLQGLKISGRPSVCSKQQPQVMWSSCFCSAGLKQMGYSEPTSFALVEKGQKGNENPLTVRHWMSLISQFSLCFAASVGTILRCVFKSNCHLQHQHSADPGM